MAPTVHGGQPYERSLDDAARKEGERMLAEAAGLATESRKDVHVSTELLYGNTTEILRAQAGEAAAIVVGSRGMNGVVMSHHLLVKRLGGHEHAR
ncbi:hypothetical protein GCM10012289_62310 [Nonomuraea cavernae]|uniref:UspA domain-containing protein n=1 Tax=Nonomuraea cavernae TaxID=2045107 RepID=A0A917ZCD7_9ACTN|nr:hypothetical protein GCM10012289_62310 [Nonomuraea cavernae]